MHVSRLLFIQVFHYIFQLKKNINKDCMATGKRPSMNLKPVVLNPKIRKQTASI